MIEKNDCCVYAHVNKINGLTYVGVTNNVKTRWKPMSYYGNNKFFKAILEFGWDNFKHYILCDNLSREMANYIEKYLIKKFNLQNDNFGYNTMSGGGTHDKDTENELSDLYFYTSRKVLYQSLNPTCIFHIGKSMSTKECSILLQIVPFVNCNNILSYDQTIINLKQMSQLLDENYDVFRRTFKCLINHDIIRKILVRKQKNAKELVSCYIINPFLCTYGNTRNKTVMNLFRKSPLSKYDEPNIFDNWVHIN